MIQYGKSYYKWCVSVTGTYDWAQCGRYCLYGSLFTAPTLYLWIRISTKIWPQTNIKVGLTKVSETYP